VLELEKRVLAHVVERLRNSGMQRRDGMLGTVAGCMASFVQKGGWRCDMRLAKKRGWELATGVDVSQLHALVRHCTGWK
jgi:hypothetical protein